MLYVDNKLVKEFPSRHISSEEDLRVLLNEYLDNAISVDEYNHILGKLEDTLDMYEGLRGHCDDLEEIIRQKDEEIARLTQEQQQQQPKKTLKKLDKKPLKRLK